MYDRSTVKKLNTLDLNDTNIIKSKKNKEKKSELFSRIIFSNLKMSAVNFGAKKDRKRKKISKKPTPKNMGN